MCERLADGDVARIGAGDAERAPLFGDIADFTRLAASLEAPALADQMTAHLLHLPT
ncbi:MAG TPA: hypothetical protein VIX81_01275 [Gammaproteobacteria bacterium]